MPTATQASSKDIIRLEILDNEGRFSFEERTYLTSNRADLTALVSQFPDTVFLIKAKPEVEISILVTLLDQLTLAGAKNVSIAAALKGN